MDLKFLTIEDILDVYFRVCSERFILSSPKDFITMMHLTVGGESTKRLNPFY